MTLSFTAAMRKFFGFRPNTSISDFATELKALSYEEKMEFWRLLDEQGGIVCDAPSKPQAA